MLTSPHILDPISCVLDGVNIIEASAGTGKTYNIQNLYVRMIMEKGFTVDEILVVTFTEAATKELRDRLRSILAEVAAFSPATADDRIRDLLFSGNAAAADIDEKQRRVARAIRDFDEAGIFTIHGFCQRVLSENAFESGILFNLELETHPDALVQEIIQDFYRERFYGLTETQFRLYHSQGIGLDSFRNFIRAKQQHVSLKVLQEGEAFSFAEIEKVLQAVKTAWNEEEISGQVRAAQLNGRSYGDKQIKKICTAITGLTGYDVSSANMKEARKFTREALAAKSSGKSRLDELKSSFFDDLEGWLAGIETCLGKMQTLHIELKDYFNSEYPRRKQQLNIQTFNDLLINVHQRLTGGDSSLAESINKRYKAVIIDEFQDTDSIQWGIFRKAFVDAAKPVFMVGDPKQAIYGFRGGDIFTYKQARSKAGKTYTLDTNFRSAPNLVSAANSLFQGINNPFYDDTIDYIQVKSGKNTDDGVLLENGIIDTKPIGILENAEKTNTEGLRQWCYEQTAIKIAEMLTGDELKLVNGGRARRLLPGDFTILVTRNADAEALKPYLQAFNIPAIVKYAGSIFESEEAQTMHVFLKTVLNPSDLKTLRGCLTSDLFCVDAETLGTFSGAQNENVTLSSHRMTDGWKNGCLDGCSKHKMHGIFRKTRFSCQKAVHVFEMADLRHKYFSSNHPGIHLSNLLWDRYENVTLSLSQWIVFFKELKIKWENHSFIEMFNYMMDEQHVRRSILQLENGERKLTNLLHLAEYVHRREQERRMGPNAVLAWLEKQRQGTKEGDDAEIRLESDSAAVNIMTIHKSKGLEFPIVFCPFLWNRDAKPRDAFSLYHDKGNLFLDLYNDDDNRKAHACESLQENMRLAYVAMTRAKFRCYLMCGKTTTKTSSPMDYMFRRNYCLNNLGLALEDGGLSEDFDIDDCWRITPSEIDLNELSEASPLRYEPSDEKPALNRKHFAGYIDYNWKITSFSGIHPSEKSAESAQDYDETDHQPEVIPEADEASELSIFNFPAGARTGSCWHEIFEIIDFRADDEAIRKTVDSTLKKFKLATGSETAVQQKQAIVFAMVKQVLAADLGGFQLCDIPMEDRLSELEFNFNLGKGFKTRAVKALLENYIREEFNSSIGDWDVTLSGGLMNGFVDLTFRRDGWFYIADWKSNKLNSRPDGFDDAGVRAEMAHHYYYLQYLIYTVALHRFLKTRLPDYDYDRHFGGVFYIFLRGVNPENSNGIFFTRPEKELIERLESCLTGWA